MKIIISPSKTKEIIKTKNINNEKIFNESITNKIISQITKLNVEEISKIFKLSIENAQKLMNFYKNYEFEEEGEAIFSYKGLVFKNLDSENFSRDDLLFAQEHLIILSALYGVLKPLSLIKNYRLDMVNKIFEKESLYKLWDSDIKKFFEGETVINLASKEYSKMLKGNAINIVDIEFLEEKNGKLKQCSTASKVLRGKIANQIIKNKILKLDELKMIEISQYKYNEELSSTNKIVFCKF